MDRVVLHCDLNNFYASVECLYNPAIRDLPVAVCGSQDLRHGIVLAKNYIAKKYKIITGEAIWQARQKCPSLVVVNPNYRLYLKFSKMVREICSRYTDLIEAFGIDESWLDITESTKLFGSGEEIAYSLKERIKEEIGITASVGVSFNKIFAKLGSDMKKPDAVTVISRENFRSLVWPLPVGELLYVGSSTKKKLNNIGITTIGDLAGVTRTFIRSMLGKPGESIWSFANGLDESDVCNIDFEQIIKGIGNSMTTRRDLVNDDDVKQTFYVLAECVAERMRRHGFKARTVQIHIRDNKLAWLERQTKLKRPGYTSGELAEAALDLFARNWDWHDPIRSLGIRATDLVDAGTFRQVTFFDDTDTQLKAESLEKSIDFIRGRFGHYSVQRAVLLTDSTLNANPIEENVIHPVSFFK